MLPRPGPPRITFTKTPGTSEPIMYEIPSSMRLKPGDDVNVMHGKARAAAAVHHVDGRDLAHGLQEDAVELRQELRHQLGALGGGRDRIAEDVPAAREKRPDRRCVVALQDERRDGRERDRLAAESPPAAGGGRPARRRASPGPEARSPALRLRPEAVRLGAGVDAEAAPVAVRRGSGRRARGPCSGSISGRPRCSASRTSRCSVRSPCRTRGGGRVWVVP